MLKLWKYEKYELKAKTAGRYHWPILKYFVKRIWTTVVKGPAALEPSVSIKGEDSWLNDGLISDQKASVQLRVEFPDHFNMDSASELLINQLTDSLINW